MRLRDGRYDRRAGRSRKAYVSPRWGLEFRRRVLPRPLRTGLQFFRPVGADGNGQRRTAAADGIRQRGTAGLPGQALFGRAAAAGTGSMQQAVGCIAGRQKENLGRRIRVWVVLTGLDRPQDGLKRPRPAPDWPQNGLRTDSDRPGEPGNSELCPIPLKRAPRVKGQGDCELGIADCGFRIERRQQIRAACAVQSAIRTSPSEIEPS